MNVKDRRIIEEFRKERENFVKLECIVSGILNRIIADASVPVSGIEHRIKTEESLEIKLYRSGDEFKTFGDLRDLFAARIICYFADDVERIGKMVEKCFEIDREHSIDKRALLRADSFGYVSMHYVCRLKKEDGYPKELTDKKFEIQIRTMLQHAWASINHDLGYKTKFGVPDEVVREFARLAGLLEIADNEFMRARDHITEYTETVRAKIISDTDDDIRIDLISLREYMLLNKKMQAFLRKLSKIEGSEISHSDPEGYIMQLRWLHIDTVGELKAMLDENGATAMRIARKALEGTEIDIIASGAALRFLCQARLTDGDYSDREITEFAELSAKGADRAERYLNRIRSLQNELKEEKLLYDRALELAEKKHAGQTRTGGDPYVTHPVAVAQKLRECGYGAEYTVTGLFHDLLEDTDATEQEILEIGGERVLKAVKLLTKTRGYDMNAYIAEIKKDPVARAVKAADRLHNLECATVCDKDFKKKYIDETAEYFTDLDPDITVAAENLLESMDLSEDELAYYRSVLECAAP